MRYPVAVLVGFNNGYLERSIDVNNRGNSVYSQQVVSPEQIRDLRSIEKAGDRRDKFIIQPLVTETKVCHCAVCRCRAETGLFTGVVQKAVS